MQRSATETKNNRIAQLQYLAEDRELLALIWTIAALPDDARVIIRLMVDHLAAVSKQRGDV